MHPMPETFSKMSADINMHGDENSAKNLEGHIESFSYQRSPNKMVIKFVQYDGASDTIQYTVSS